MGGAARGAPIVQFAELSERFAGRDGVALPNEPGSRGFGTDALKVRGSIFAMLVRGQLVVKLPRRRVDELVEVGSAERFDANRGRPMKEWAVLLSTEPTTWAELAEEAMQHVRGVAKARRNPSPNPT